MESINVKEAQQVAKGDQIGVTGASGLAGGDHLHFSILVGQKFVNPIEWWDPHWLQDNVDKKIKEVS
jgi:murein DD-endopeptidase MepM/ murein hydrolase activator NlpD